MAEQLADQLVVDYRKYPIDDHGKMRIQYFSVSALAVAYAQNDTIVLFKLPPGRVRVLPCLSRISNSAFGAARTLSIGNKAYMKRPPIETLEPLLSTTFITALDVSGANAGLAWGTGIKFDIYSTAGVDIYATVLGGTMPIGASMSGYMTYIYE